MKPILAIVVAACGLSILADTSVAIPGIGEATVTCAEGNGWKFDVRAEAQLTACSGKMPMCLKPIGLMTNLYPP